MKIHSAQGTNRILVGLALAAAMMVPHQTWAAGPALVDLGSATNFAVLAGLTIVSTGGGGITGDVGLSPGTANGMSATQVFGTIYAVDASGPAGSVIDPGLLTTAKVALTAAYIDAAGRPSPDVEYAAAQDIGGMNLGPGLYRFDVSAGITGTDVTLSGGANDVWIFQIASTLTVGSGINVILAGGAQARNIFWQVGSSATLGTSSDFKGTIMALDSITMDTSSTMEGRALARNATVTYNGQMIRLPVPVVVPEISGLGALALLATLAIRKRRVR